MAGEKISPDVSVVSIHYNDPEMLQASLQSLVIQRDIAIESIIVDNSGNFPVQALKDFPFLHQYINPGYNSGFARGVNAGLKAATGEYILMLNQDATLTKPDALAKCIEKLKTLPQKTILGVNLVDIENQYQRSIWPEDPGFQKELQSSAVYIKISGRKNPGNHFHKELEKQHEISGFVHRINGAFLLFHRSLIDQDKLFWDVDFFLYGEDVEWAHRCRKKGWRFYHFADVTAQHIGSASSSDGRMKRSAARL